MEKNNKSINGLIERFALLSDEVGGIFPNGKSVVVFSLNDEDFNFAKTQVGNYDGTTKQFKIDISGIEFIFLRDELLNDAEGTI